MPGAQSLEVTVMDDMAFVVALGGGVRFAQAKLAGIPG